MGLAASQVRMLSLTSRKASIERDILQNSNRKIALSREMNNLANEYYDALSAERLMYLSNSGEYTNLSYQYLMGRVGGIEDIDVKSDHSMLLIDTLSGEVVLSHDMASKIGFNQSQLASSSQNIYIAIARLCGDVNITHPNNGKTYIINPELVKDICAGKYDTFTEQDLANAIKNPKYNLWTIDESSGNAVDTTVTITTEGNYINQPFVNDYNDDKLHLIGAFPNNMALEKITADNTARNIAAEYFHKSSYNELSLQEKIAVAKVMQEYGQTVVSTSNLNMNGTDVDDRVNYAYKKDGNLYFDTKLFINAIAAAYTAITEQGSAYDITSDQTVDQYLSTTDAKYNAIYNNVNNSSNYPLIRDLYNISTDDGDDANGTMDNRLVLLSSKAKVNSTTLPDFVVNIHIFNSIYGAYTSDYNETLYDYFCDTGGLVDTSQIKTLQDDINGVWGGQAGLGAIASPSDPAIKPGHLQYLNPAFIDPGDGHVLVTEDTDRLKFYTLRSANTQDNDHVQIYGDASALFTLAYAEVLGENIGYIGNIKDSTGYNNFEFLCNDSTYTTTGAEVPYLDATNLVKLINFKSASKGDIFEGNMNFGAGFNVETTQTGDEFVPAGEIISQWIQNFKDLIADVKFYYPIVTACAKFGYTDKYDKNLKDSEYIDKNIQNGIFQLMSFETKVFSLNSAKDTDYYLLTSEFSKMNDPAQQAIITAWYETEKAEINSKETYLDTQIENLSAELNSINTEIDSVKSLIDDAVKHTFDWGKGA